MEKLFELSYGNSLFSNFSPRIQQLIFKFLDDDEIKDLINMGAFTEVYAKLEKFAYEKYTVSTVLNSVLSALLLDANIDVWGPHGKIIYNNCFQDLANLKEFIVPEGVTYIDEDAFYRCFSLRIIHLPSTLEDIGQDAFVGCDNLEEIYFNGTKEQLKNLKEKHPLQYHKLFHNLSIKVFCTDFTGDAREL